MDHTIIYILIIILIVFFLWLLIKKSINKCKELFRDRRGYACGDCNSKTNYAHCILCEDCVWCPLDRKCVPGNEYGPYNNINNLRNGCQYWKHLSNFTKVASCLDAINPTKPCS